MKTTNWKDIAEVIGIAAIVASLIFVGLQMKQSQDIAVAGQYQARADAALEFHIADMQSDATLQYIAMRLQSDVDAGRLGDAVRRSLEIYGPEVTAARSIRFRSLITMYDNYHFQFEQGFLTMDSWLAFRARFKTALRNDVNAEMYQRMKEGGRQTFVAECDQILREIAEDRE